VVFDGRGEADVFVSQGQGVPRCLVELVDEEVEGLKVGGEDRVVRLVEGATGQVLAGVDRLLQLRCLRLPGGQLDEEFIQKGHQLVARERSV
jgi:hypothetical protein